MSKGPDKAPEPRRHHSKFKLKSIHVDELLNAAGMSGFLSPLDRPAETPDHLKRLAEEMLIQYETSNETLPERYSDVIRKRQSTDSKHVKKQNLKTGIPITGTPYKGIHVSGTPEMAAIVIPSLRLPRTPTIRAAVLAQDGHSFGEQAVYQALWDNAQPHDADSRLISVGYRTLSQLCHLTVNNCKANLLALGRKLAIKEISNYGPTQAKTYQVFSYAAILRKRRQAGLTHYIKSRGVAFVHPETGQPFVERGIPKSGIPLSNKGIPESGHAGIPVSATPSLDTLVRHTSSAKSPSSSPFADLRKALEAIISVVDDDLIMRLVYACLKEAPDIEEVEIAKLVQLKAKAACAKNIQNPAGFLLTALPNLLIGDGILRLRQIWREKEGQGTASEDNLRVQLEAMLADESSPESDRDFARRVLLQLDNS